MRRRVVASNRLLAERSFILRYLAESEFPLSTRALAFVHFYCELHGCGALRVFLCEGRETTAIADTKILAKG